MYTEKQNLWEIAGEDMSSVADQFASYLSYLFEYK